VFALDDQFLVDVGLAELPQEDRAAFLQHVYETLELRVGTALSDGMSDAQLAEYESIIDRDVQRVTAWLDAHAPDFLDDPSYVRLARALEDKATQTDVVCEYASTKWLEVNRPDYRDLVKAVFEEMKNEIRPRAAELLAQDE
jgi:hypothetical protein